MVHGLIRDPVNWILGGLGSITAVGAAALLDPTGAVAAFLATTLAQAPTLFTLSGIGIAAAGRVPSVQDFEPILKVVWIGSGLIFAGGLADRYWDSLKERIL